MPDKKKLNIIIYIIIAGFALSVFFHYILANYFGLNYYPLIAFDKYKISGGKIQ